ncbi:MULTISPECIES: pentapeptide repeat-containing protein [unclassified Clostridioides]|uniref:pentapeptide repeat-containing protein n=1 Tax=unclassified Clostridioides TaxID=2635829 RepID=UPI0006BBFF87|nr:pentapeptide repeat protein [Clostridioides difficile]MCC0692994.1 pentapeptide repeat-containing protein [Clostridioides sp. ZZV14-6387]MCI9975870.1 pentapeptide repeat-containing protein [Clostridioides difficile]MDB3084657.1 pentapeptide repeat-containing protein [Clostridioides difficile]MDI0265397.1 pentapeptide repeat-containing protein [Clostridioides difficile]
MNNTQKIETGLKYNKAKKMDKNFMYQDLKRSNCYNTDFSNSNFNFTSLRGAHFKSCNFYGCTFKSAEIIGANLKRSKFKNAKFENTIFEGVNLEEVDFSGTKFKNVIFLNTDITKAKNFDINSPQIKVFKAMPIIEMSERLENAIKFAMENKYVKKSRTLDTKDGGINYISIMVLLENFKEKQLIDGLTLIGERIDKEFCTLSYIMKNLEVYKSEGIL